jgi:hypothetical protein
MDKKVKKNNWIKDSISKLFILRDSCTGTCITQKNTPNIVWFEGAAVLLNQGVEKLKSAQHKIDSDDKDASKDFCVDVKDTVSKLIVLKNSCRGVSRKKESDENVNWYEGAEAIICEVIDQLQKALEKTETQTDTSPAADSSESKESASSDTAADSKPVVTAVEEKKADDDAAAADSKPVVAAVEEKKTDDDADEVEKQAAAG